MPLQYLIFQVPDTYGLSYSASIDIIGCSTTFGMPTEESLVVVTALEDGSLSNAVSGKGDLHGNHFIGNGQGASALVRANVMNASSYTCSYEKDRILIPYMEAPGGSRYTAERQ
jgi:hypothetical protein